MVQFLLWLIASLLFLIWLHLRAIDRKTAEPPTNEDLVVENGLLIDKRTMRDLKPVVGTPQPGGPPPFHANLTEEDIAVMREDSDADFGYPMRPDDAA